MKRDFVLILIVLLFQPDMLALHAADPAPPPSGFTPGNQPFPNPFTPPPSDTLDDEDEEFEAVAPSTTTPTPTAARPSRPNTRPTTMRPTGKVTVGKPKAAPKKAISVGGQKDPDDVPDPQPGQGGVEVGGEPPSGVVSGNDFQPLSVNLVTGAGPGAKEVVTDFNYPDADILDLAKTIGKLTGKNFIFEKTVKGRISIVSNGPITVGDAWRAFLTALDINGFALIPSGKYIRIARNRDARDKQVDTFTGGFTPDTDQLITKVFALKYINSDEVARTLRSFMPANSRIIPYAQTNTLIVTDTGSNILKLAKMLTFLDIEGFDAGIEVIRVQHASAVELSKLIDKLIPGTGGSARPNPGGFGGGTFAARKTKAGGVINTIIADERTNNLIIHANSQGAKEVRELIQTLDRKVPAAVGGGRIHVMYLQHADAEEMTKTLTTLNQAGSKPAGGAKPGGLGENPTESQLFQSDIKVAADKATNSLVITASPADFETLKRVIAKLDIPRDEVYVEAVIMEVSLGRSFEFSSAVGVPTGGNGIAGAIPGGDLLSFLQNPASQKGLVLGFGLGNDKTITVGGTSVTVKDVNGLIRAIQSNNKANILATPQIMTLDNVEATFETSEKIPVPKATVSNGVVANTIEKEKVTLSLKIKPQIKKASNFVKLEIKTVMEDISKQNVPSSLEGQTFGSFSRNADTQLVIADGDTVVLGGLVRDKRNETVAKVPILGDIPLLGWLFRDKRETVEKTNLLIFITPHIIRHYEKVRAVMDKKLQERDDFIQKNAGGEDPQRDARDDMIRNLPDIKEIIRRKEQQSFTLDGEEEAKAALPQETTISTTPETPVSQSPSDPAGVPQQPPPFTPEPQTIPPPPPDDIMDNFE